MKVTRNTRDAIGYTSGSWTLWSLSDGYIDLPAALLIDPAHGHSGTTGSTNDQVRLSVNCFLLQRLGQETILIDCGAGGSWNDTLGYLGRAFEAAGISPDEVKVLLFTHAHNDHINGLLTRDSKEAFPNLGRIVIPAEARKTFDADESLARFRPLLTPLEAGAEPVPGLVAVSLPGHAAGHTGYRLDTGDDTILICGDIVHVPAQQFGSPELTWTYDEDQESARETRLRCLDEAARDGTWLAGAHLGRPGMGQVVRKGKAYRFDPIGTAPPEAREDPTTG